MKQTTSLSGPLCGWVNNWDDHAVNHHVFDGMRLRSGAYDQAVTALIEDIYERGLDKRVLVVVTGHAATAAAVIRTRSSQHKVAICSRKPNRIRCVQEMTH